MGRLITGARRADHEQGRNGSADRRDHRERGVDRERQREEYGGFNIGAAFFGWLVAIGMAALLTAVLSAAGAAIGLTKLDASEARAGAETISLVGGILLAAVLIVAYFAGGYVAGRMSRFDGGRQGIGAWLFGFVVTLALAVAGAIAGAKYNVLSNLNLPSIPVDGASFAKGGAIALVVMLLGTLLASFLGGKAGERYHRKVDRVGGAL